MMSQDYSNYTALGIAAREGHTDISTMLIKAGADVNHRDSKVTWLIPLFSGSTLLISL
jgi:ankyrin repeat protein